VADQTHRNTIFLEDAEVLEHETHPGEQFILRVRAPKCAAAARAGSFAHLTCDPALPMRRPLSIMRVDPDAGLVEFLYKIVGQGLRLLSLRRPGDRLSLLGPIGRPFRPNPGRPWTLLIGGGVGIPPMMFLADTLRRGGAADWQPLVLMGSEVPFPFATAPAGLAVAGIPASASHALTLLERQGVPSRLASAAGLSGCYPGFVTELADAWLTSLSSAERGRVSVYACGPTPMLEATAALAARHGLPCQVSLEEYMACAVGGCAGCTVLVRTDTGPAMKRVCVDGPVFDAAAVFPPAA
jgi:dihydroorotate dehydrogenase electron transfer subunit